MTSRNTLMHESKTMKYDYDREVTTVKTIRTTQADGKEQVQQQSIVETRNRKVTLLTYEHSDKEDNEHFFNAFEKLKNVLQEEWDSAAISKTEDATVLFNAFDAMLSVVFLVLLTGGRQEIETLHSRLRRGAHR